MHIVNTLSHNEGIKVWKQLDLYDSITAIFEAPALLVQERSTTTIRQHVKKHLAATGWAFNVRIDAQTALSVFARKDNLAFQLQTGNISRYAYDLLKLQFLHSKGEVDAAALAVPTKTASHRIGSNVAHADRIWNELTLFDCIITLPIMLVAFE